MSLIPNVHTMDVRFKTFDFKSSKIPIDNWMGNSKVQQLHNWELQKKFKTQEEKLIYRVDMWISMNRIKRFSAFMPSNQFPPTKRLTPFKRTSSLDRHRTSSMDSLHLAMEEGNRNKKNSMTLDGKAIRSMRLLVQQTLNSSRSTSALDIPLDKVECDVHLSENNLKGIESDSKSWCSTEEVAKFFTPETHEKRTILDENTDDKITNVVGSDIEDNVILGSNTDQKAKDLGYNDNEKRKKKFKITLFSLDKKKKAMKLNIKSQNEGFESDFEADTITNDLPRNLRKHTRNRSAPDVSKLASNLKLPPHIKAKNKIGVSRKYSDTVRHSWAPTNNEEKLFYINAFEEYV